MAIHFHPLGVKRVSPDAAGSAAITLAVPDALRDTFVFQAGQFLTAVVIAALLVLVTGAGRSRGRTA